MTTGAKIAIGCGVAVLVAGLVVAGLVVGGAWWAKGKIDQFAGHEERIQELHKRANQNAFTRPADGVIQEDRLVKFIDIRKRIFGTYEKHRPTIEAMGKKEKGDLGDLTQGISIINEIRLAQAEALADGAMSEEEYSFLVEQVYKTAWAAEVAKSTGGKSMSEAAAEMHEKAAQEMERARQQAEAASEAADQKGADATEEAAEDQKEKLAESVREMKEQAEKIRREAKDLDVPKANIALFQKYEADIKKYAMSGLEMIGL